MTEIEFIRKYEDRIAGVCIRGMRNMAKGSGDSAWEGQAFRQILLAIDDLITEMKQDLYGKKVADKPAPVIPHGRK